MPPTCGEKMTLSAALLGRFRSGLSRSVGSGATQSKPAPAIMPSVSAEQTARLSTSSPRAVLMRYAVFFILPIKSALTIFTVDSVTGR